MRFLYSENGTHITFRVSAPSPGPFAEAIAEEVGTFLRAAASFATAAPLLGSPPLFPADEAQIEEATEKLSRTHLTNT
jgi:hypothetical protein